MSLRSDLELIKNDHMRHAILEMHDDLEPRMRTQPAAQRRHHAWPGGYYTHVEQVVSLGIKFHRTLLDLGCPVPPLDDVILVCFVHDLDKLIRYQKVEPDGFSKLVVDGKLVDPPITFDYIDRPPFESSGYVATECARFGFFPSLEHLHAISCHHGGWAPTFSSVYARPANMSPLATIVHCADLCSARLWGKRPDE